MLTVFIVLIISVCVTFFVSVFVSALTFKKTYRRGYSFFNEFPYELYSPFKENKNIFYLISSIVYVALSIASFIPYISLAGNNTSTIVYFTLIAAIYLVAQLVYLSLVLIPAFHIKVHAMLATIFFCFSLLASSTFGFSLISIYNYLQSPGLIVLSISSFVIAAFEICIIFNPKLKDWTLLEKQPDDEWTLTYARPKVFPLAISEWLIIFSQFALSLIVLLSFLVSYFVK